MRKLFFASLMLIGTFGVLELATPPAQAIDCSLVRGLACPDGFVWSPIGNNCCRCVPA